MGDVGQTNEKSHKSSANKIQEAELHQVENQKQEEIKGHEKNKEKCEFGQTEKVPFTLEETSLNEPEDLEHSQKQTKSASVIGKAQALLEGEEDHTTKLESVESVKDKEGKKEFQKENENQTIKSDQNQIIKESEIVKGDSELDKARFTTGKSSKSMIGQEPSKEGHSSNIPTGTESFDAKPQIRETDVVDETKYQIENSVKDDMETKTINLHSNETISEKRNQDLSIDNAQSGQYGSEKRHSRPTSRQQNNDKDFNEDKDEANNRPDSRGSMSGFTQTEPAEWYQQDDNEDELMIILDTEHMI